MNFDGLVQTDSIKSSPKNQYFAGGIILSTVSVSIGLLMGISAILLPQLEDESFLESKSDAASWIASVVNLGPILGSIMSGIFAGLFGRKKTIITSNLILIAGWATIGFSNGSITAIILGRILQGVGMLTSVSQIYLVEIADSKRRGLIAGSGPFFVNSGITLAYALGAGLPWRWVCLACACFPLVTIFFMPILPESPNWLMERGKIDEAEKTLRWLRGEHYDVGRELDTMRPTTNNNQANESLRLISAEDNSNNVQNINNEERANVKNLDLVAKPALMTGVISMLAMLIKPSALKPFTMLLVLFTLQQACGSFADVLYAIDVFKDAGVSTNPYGAAIITGVIRQVGSLVGTFLLSRCSRRKMMVISAFFMGLSMAGLGGNVQFNEGMLEQSSNVTGLNSTDQDEHQSILVQALAILPIVEITIYMVSFGIGVGMVPWLLLGELFPTQVKSFASGVVGCVAHVMMFVVVKTFPFLVLSLGSHGAYYTYAGFCFATSVFSFFVIPETGGKSMAQLQALYQKGNKTSEIQS